MRLRVRISARLYDAEWLEVITAKTASGEDIRIEVIGDEYACGISSMSGIRWNHDTPNTANVDGWLFTWHEPIQRSESL